MISSSLSFKKQSYCRSYDYTANNGGLLAIVYKLLSFALKQQSAVSSSAAVQYTINDGFGGLYFIMLSAKVLSNQACTKHIICTLQQLMCGAVVSSL